MENNNPQSRQNHITSLSEFLKDVMHLAVYATESGRLSGEIQMEELYRMWDIKITQQNMLSDDDIAYLQDCYLILSRQLAPTTAISLRATESKLASTSKDYMNTDAGRHVRNMWFASFVALAAIVLMNLYQHMFEFNAALWAIENAGMFEYATYFYKLGVTLIPFLYGAFGASVFMLRQAETQLQERTFDPRRLPEFRNRLVLGTLSGGVIVLLYSNGGIAETNIKITEAALGFIGGYSIDLLFTLLDRIVDSFKPAEKRNTNTTHSPTPAIERVLKRKRVDRTTNEGKETTPQLVPVTKKKTTVLDDGM